MTIGFLTLKDEEIFCTLTFSFNGLGRDIWVGCQFTIHVAVIVVYSILRKKLKSQVVDMKTSLQLMKSIYTVMILYIVCWVTAMVALLIGKITNSSKNVETAIEMAFGLVTLSNTSVPCVVYFVQSAKYRRAILRLFGRRPGEVTCSVLSKKQF
ncbi:hypothetical protein L596_024657 [Steinernema carpocapsae]|uniref:G-protein coupled receptors family 1 profile domain-containing protein n=1 Tax=Steinernema carpocapsae TaxID=34508 RepID=A0A4U5M5D2_STECR|nr:hypothetical protein L596_024657 [Steinernema carpocapsae]